MMEIIQLGTTIGLGIGIALIIIGCAGIAILGVVVYALALVDWFRK